RGESQMPFRGKLAAPLSLMIAAALVISIGASTIPTLATGWMALITIWALFVEAARRDPENRLDPLKRAAFMMSALAFLGLAAAAQPELSTLLLFPDTWTESARVLAMFAGAILAGAFPFLQWRPTRGKNMVGAASLIQLAPSAAGAFFLVRLAGGGQNSGSLFTLLLTALGLVGFIYGISKIWSSREDSLAKLTGFAVSQLSLLMLAVAWSSRETTLLLTQTLLLGVGGLYLAEAWPRVMPRWLKVPVWFQAAAITAVPLTSGFVGLASLYSDQITAGRMILAVVTAVLMIPITARTILFIPEVGRNRREARLSRLNYATLTAALALPALGLLTVPLSNEVIGGAAGWMLILMSIAVGIVLGWYVYKNPEVREAIGKAVQVSLPHYQGSRVLRSITSSAGLLVREAAAILEGEGGMLWLLVLVVILWLARIS
ncbi:MAG: hypothetical protein ACK2T3_10405, partial [Candidatus Promineifilaceae bacterium]